MTTGLGDAVVSIAVPCFQVAPPSVLWRAMIVPPVLLIVKTGGTARATAAPPVPVPVMVPVMVAVAPATRMPLAIAGPPSVWADAVILPVLVSVAVLLADCNSMPVAVAGSTRFRPKRRSP